MLIQGVSQKPSPLKGQSSHLMVNSSVFVCLSLSEHRLPSLSHPARHANRPRSHSDSVGQGDTSATMSAAHGRQLRIPVAEQVRCFCSAAGCFLDTSCTYERDLSPLTWFVWSHTLIAWTKTWRRGTAILPLRCKAPRIHGLTEEKNKPALQEARSS